MNKETIFPQRSDLWKTKGNWNFARDGLVMITQTEYKDYVFITYPYTRAGEDYSQNFAFPLDEFLEEFEFVYRYNFDKSE
jgi:hypothetical protein